MSRFTLADRQSATILHASDSLDDMFETVEFILHEDGADGLQGLSLSMEIGQSGQFENYDDAEVLRSLEALRAEPELRTLRR